MNKKVDFAELDRLVKLDVSPAGSVFYGALFFIFLIWGINTEDSLPAAGLAILIVFGVAYLIYRALKIAGKNTEVLFAFAAQNNFQFEKENRSIGEIGSLYKRGHDKKETNIITGEFAEMPMRLSDYQYTTGHGKYRTDYLIRVMCLTLPRHLPHMVIDCEVENDSNGLSSLPITFDQSQKIELEGDFHKYFNLYVPDKYGVSALSIIAPDAMEALMRMKALCDIEIIGNCIYFYWPETDMKRANYEKVFATVEEVMREVGDKLKSGDIFAHKTQADLHISDSKNPVRLKKSYILSFLSSGNASILYAGLFIFVIAFPAFIRQYISFNISDSQLLAAILIASILIIGLIIYVIHQQIRRHQLRKELKQRYHS